MGSGDGRRRGPRLPATADCASVEPSLSYAEQLANASLYVLYPAPFQHVPLAAPNAQGVLSSPESLSSLIMSLTERPLVYAAVDWTNAHGGWIACLLLPVVCIACITSDLVVSAFCLLAGGVVVWALGFR